MGGIQNQYAPNGYIRLFSCVEGFRRDDLTRALERRTVVNATLMRATIHLVSKRDYWPFAVAVRGPQREWWLRLQRPRPDERTLKATARKLDELMADGPRTHRELAPVVGRGWGMVGPWLELVRVPPSGTWEQRRAHLFQTAERWVGPEDVSPDDALDHLVRRYLGGFGPAPRTDIASWAHVKPRDLAPALERLSLRRFRDEQGKELLDLPRAPLPDPETPAPVRFLPTWDAILLVHARRTGVLPEEYRPLVFSTQDPALGGDVSRGRRRGRNVALRGRSHRDRGVRAATPCGGPRGCRGGRKTRRVPCVMPCLTLNANTPKAVCPSSCGTRGSYL